MDRQYLIKRLGAAWQRIRATKNEMDAALTNGAYVSPRSMGQHRRRMVDTEHERRICHPSQPFDAAAMTASQLKDGVIRLDSQGLDRDLVGASVERFHQAANKRTQMA